MDSLLTAFIAAALGQWGDKTQWLAAALSARYGRPGAIVLGIAIAATANALIAGIGGSLLHGMVTPRALTLLIALALALAAVDGLLGRRPKKIGETWRHAPLVTALFSFFVFGFGDKSQFVTAAIAARFDAPLLAAAGAAAGTIASVLPAALLGDRFESTIPVKAIRIGVAILFLVVAFVLAVNALRLT